MVGPRPEPAGLYAVITLVCKPFAPLINTHDHLPRPEVSDPVEQVSAILSYAIISVPPC